MSITLLGGDEPYLIDCRRVSVVRNLQMPELNYYASDTFDSVTLSHLYTCPVIDENRVAFIKIDDLKELNTEFFREYLKNPSGVLIVQFRKFDARSSFYKEMEKSGFVVMCSKESALPSLKAFLIDQAKKKKVAFKDDALDLFLARVDYTDNEDVNLYTLLGYMSSLAALGSTITKEMVNSIIPEHHRDCRFDIAKLIVRGDVDALRTQAELLTGDAIGVLSALLREYRVAYKATYYPLQDIGVGYLKLNGFQKDRLIKGIEIITDAIASVKRGGIPMDSVLFDTFCRLI